MSQYANAVAERSYPLTSAYCHRVGPTNNSDGSCILPMPMSSTQGAHHQSQNWPQYYAEHHSLPQPSNFNSSYVSSSDLSSCSAACMPYAGIRSTGSSMATVGDVSTFGHEEQSFDGDSRPVQYQSSAQSPLPDYPTSSQRTFMPPSSPPQSTTFAPMYRFTGRRNRDVSPSSYTSASDYGSGRDWESPGPFSEHQQYAHSQAGQESQDTSSASGARYPSQPASTAGVLSSQTSVKIEPDDPDSRFIMELSSMTDGPEDFGSSASTRSEYRSSLLSQSLAPPTEVPLRATQASKEMRCMMGVFRLNPFAMHSLSVSVDENIDGQGSPGLDGPRTQASWCGEARPLEEEPVILEFQLSIDGIEVEGEKLSPSGTVGKDDLGNLDVRGRCGLGVSELGLRSFSPSFELHPSDGDTESDSNNRERAQTSPKYSQEREFENDLENESWRDAEYGGHSEVDTSSTTTRSVHTPLYDSPQAQQTQAHGIYEPHHDKESSSSAAWDAVNEQYLGEENYYGSSPQTSSPMKHVFPYANASVRVPRLHTTTSHPYLRKNQYNHQENHGHSQSFSNAPSHSLPYVQKQPQSELSLLHLSTHHSQQNNAHTPCQYSSDDLSQLKQHHQSNVPPYTVPVMGPNNIDDVQHLAGGIPPSYMRIRRRLADEESDYEHHARVYSPSNASSASNDAFVYPQVPESLTHRGSLINVASNRRWSLPETGAGVGHGVVHGSSFLSTM